MDYSYSSFPPAYYGIGRSLVLLHRHSEALESVKKGIGFLSSHHLVLLTWPGTSVHIGECHLQDIQVRASGMLERERVPEVGILGVGSGGSVVNIGEGEGKKWVILEREGR